ncbi:MAG: VWA domain-containing protein [Thermoanaerobaculia bacterium]
MRRTCASVLSAFLLGAGTLEAQDPADSVRETAEAVLVEVPVRVIDRHGKPIRGLEANDFEVFDDGRKQQILAFDRIDLAQKSLSPGEPEPIHPAARRHFLLLFDYSFAHPKSILAAQRAAKEFVLTGTADTDFVAVVTYSVERGLKLLVTFSSDRVQVCRAVENLGLVPTEDLSRDPLGFAFDIARVSPVSTSVGLKEANAAAITETLQTMMSITRARVDEYARQRVRRLTESLRELATTLDSVSGRKDIIFLSEGFESRLVTGTKDTERERDWILSGEYWKVDSEKRFGSSTLKEDFRQVGELFRRTDCVLHAVDIAGLKLDPETTSVQDSPMENSLFELVEPTGGEVLRNSNDFREQFARLLASTNLVYVLSFRPERSGQEGRFHPLKVKVKVPGARVLARAGYYERPSFRVLSPLERSLLAADVLANEVPVAEIPARLLASPLPDGTGPARVPVLIGVPGPELLSQQRGERLAVEIYVYAHDSEKRLSDFFTRTVNVDLSIHRERVEKGGLRYYGELTLLPGVYRVRALVRNGETGRMGLAAETVRVPDFSERQPYLAPPLFLESSAEGIFVRGRASEAGRARGARPVALPAAGAGLVPAALPEVRAGSPAQVSVVAYYFGEPEPQALKIGAQVLSEEGRPLKEGTIRVLHQSPAEPDGKQVVMVSFTPEDLSPGRYALRVFLQDSATGKAGHASSPFLVR